MAAEPAKDDPKVVDEELEKRKKRAARFGVPLVGNPTPKPQTQPAKSPSNSPRKTSKTATEFVEVCARQGDPRHNALNLVQQDPEKLRARQARFGAPNKPATAAAATRKRPAEEEVDAEELEKRKKRAARFGLPVCLVALFSSQHILLTTVFRRPALEYFVQHSHARTLLYPSVVVSVS